VFALPEHIVCMAGTPVSHMFILGLCQWLQLGAAAGGVRRLRTGRLDLAI